MNRLHRFAILFGLFAVGLLLIDSMKLLGQPPTNSGIADKKCGSSDCSLSTCAVGKCKGKNNGARCTTICVDSGASGNFFDTCVSDTGSTCTAVGVGQTCTGLCGTLFGTDYCDYDVPGC